MSKQIQSTNEMPKQVRHDNRVFLNSFQNPNLKFGRNVPCKPRLVGGVKGHNMKRDYLTGKPRPVAGELHILRLTKGLFYFFEALS